MQQTITELAESLRKLLTVWKMIGKPFAHVDQLERPGVAIRWPDTHFRSHPAPSFAGHWAKGSRS